MIRLIRWWLTASIRYSHLAVRAILRLPLLLLPIPQRVRNRVAGALAIAFSFLPLLIPVVLSDAPWWAQLMVVAAAALVPGPEHAGAIMGILAEGPLGRSESGPSCDSSDRSDGVIAWTGARRERHR